jgi:hypothetical protein
MNSVYGKELSFLLSPMDEFEGWTHSHLWPLVDEYNPGKMPRKMSMWGHWSSALAKQSGWYTI